MGFSLAAATGVKVALTAVHELLIAVASIVEPRALGLEDFNSCRTWAQQLQFPGSRAQAQ